MTSRRLLVSLVTTSVVLTCSLSAQSPKARWQTSWPAFLRVLAPELSPFPPKPYKQFAGKEVTWEGAVRDVGATPDTRIRIEMSPDSTHGYHVNVQLFATASMFDQWKAIPIGSRVRFRAVVDSSFPVLVFRAGGPSGTPVAAIKLSSGEILGVVKGPHD